MTQSAKADEPPKARRGFQMALRVGAAIPMGSFNEGNKLADMSKVQIVPFIVDIGGKLGENVFLGGYVGLGIGGANKGFENLCEVSGADCATASFRIGAQIHYHFLPAELTNPWLGYGIGVQSFALAMSAPGQPDMTMSALGFDFAHFMGGVDFRVSRVFGFGPFVDYSIGQYSEAEFDVEGVGIEGEIREKAIHSWLTLGLRGTFFP